MIQSRNTRQKSLIMECMRAADGRHITADEIADELRRNRTPVAKSTVYRYLAQLEDSGHLRKYTVADGQPACYQLTGPACGEHFHLMCRTCGQIVHFESAPLGDMLSGLKDSTGLTIDGNKTVFYGRCADCSG